MNQAVLQHLNPAHVEVEIWRADELEVRHGLSSELDEMWSYVRRADAGPLAPAAGCRSQARHAVARNVPVVTLTRDAFNVVDGPVRLAWPLPTSPGSPSLLVSPIAS